MKQFDVSVLARELADSYLKNHNHKENIAKNKLMRFMDLLFEANKIIEKSNNEFAR